MNASCMIILSFRKISIFLFMFGLLSLQSACVHIATAPSPVRKAPAEIKKGISPGDTRSEVRSILGEPLLDARGLGLEVYRRSARDIEMGIAFVMPIVTPGPDHVVIAMVLYDSDGLVSEYSVKYGKTGDYNLFMYPKISTSVGGFVFENVSYKEPETLYGPILPLNVLTKSDPKITNRCVVIFLMGQCPMEKILLDERKIIDFGAGVSCQYLSGKINQSYIVQYIDPGSHELTFSHERPFGRFKESFSCRADDIVFAEMIKKRTIEDWWHGQRLEGNIRISVSPSAKILEKGKYRRILWHDGKWLVPSQSD